MAHRQAGQKNSPLARSVGIEATAARLASEVVFVVPIGLCRAASGALLAIVHPFLLASRHDENPHPPKGAGVIVRRGDQAVSWSVSLRSMTMRARSRPISPCARSTSISVASPQSNMAA